MLLPGMGGKAKALAAWVLLGVACGGPAERAPAMAPGAPVILISVDTLRSDRLPPYGYKAVATPHLDALARESVLFERAYSACPLTLPSHATLFTGLWPPQHGVRDNRGYALPDEVTTLAERLREAGYATYGAVSSMVLRRQTGIAQGFDRYNDALGGSGAPRPGTPFAQRRGEATFEVLRPWLDELPRGRPWFFFLHLYDPHSPYDPPEPFRSRYADPYDGEVAYTDHVLGMFFEELRRRDLYNAALILFLSDHGEGLGDHVEREHGLFLYREALQVPLMVKLPRGQQAGTRVAEPVSLADVAPTVLALLGLDPGPAAGVNLFDPSERDEARVLYSETWFPRLQYGLAELRAAIEGRWHYIEAPRPEFYDLLEDPAERNNLVPAREIPARMVQALEAIGRGKAATVEISAEEAEALASLGYVGGAVEGETLGDPKDYVEDIEALWRLVEALESGGEVAGDLAQLLERLPVRHEPLRRAVAHRLLAGGRAAAAWSVLEPLLDSKDAATQRALGEAAAGLGRRDEAGRYFRKALELAPGDAQAHFDLGVWLLEGGRAHEAAASLQRAVELDPALGEAWNALGVARARLGDPAGAFEAWRRAVESAPALADAWYNLALGLDRAGRRDEALAALRRYASLVRGAERQRAEALIARLEGRRPAP